MKRLLAAALITTALVAAGCSSPAGTYTAPHSDSKTPANPKASPLGGPVGDTVLVTAEDVVKKLKNGDRLVIVDLRTSEEYAQGHAPDSVLIPLQSLEKEIARYPKDQEIYLIDASGNASAQAFTKLSNLGYTKLHTVVGGMAAWKAVSGPMVM